MKLRHLIHLIACCAAIALTSCVTTTTETIAPDGTRTIVTVRQPAPGSIEAATVATAIAVDQLSSK